MSYIEDDRADPALVRWVHKEAGERLQAVQTRRRAAEQPALTGQAERQQARKLIADVVRELNEREMTQGRSALDERIETELAEGAYARMFGAGQLQVLLDDQGIENIDINGCNEVWVKRAGAVTHEAAAPVASSDEELVQLVQTVAAHASLNSRAWDSANPELDLKLPDGSRLSAVMSVCERPVISIRRQRFDKPTLGDLQGLGSVTLEQVELLRAIVRARSNIMIAGATDAGKTTMLKAMAAEIDPGERIITIEKTLELALRDDRERHPNAIAFEERTPNSEGRGAVTMRDLVRRTLRQNPDRVIVGEVLGEEIIALLNAMGQGNDGSLSTIHCRSARQAFARIAAYAGQAPEQLSPETSNQLIVGGLDYVVYVSRHPATGARRLETILEVNGLEEGTVLASEIFQAERGDPYARFTGVQPQRYEQLLAAGWQMPGGR